MGCRNRRIGSRTLLLWGLAAGLLLNGPGRDAEAARRPDVLFIAIEDIQTCFGCYGHPICKTPHIDAFAATGLRFDNAQCQYPICNPSRSSLLSGRYPKSNGVLSNSQDWNEYLPPGTTLPECFRAGGYRTLTVGKIFHGGNQGRTFRAADRWDRIIPPGEGLQVGGAKPESPRILYDHLTAEERQQRYNSRAWTWGPIDGEDIETGDGKIAEQAVRVLSAPRAADDEPLLLAIGFHRTHLPLFAPRKYFEMYPPARMPLPDYPADDLADVPRSYDVKDHEAFTDEKRREAIAAYYACMTFVDAQVGRVLDALESSGRADETIVVLWGDHGYHIGEHLQWQKNTLFEESCRVPLIVRAPGVTSAGTVCRRPVESVDLYPTLADLCGLSVPDLVEGISMAPLLADPDLPWRKAAFTVCGPGVSIRTERYRYTEYGGPDKAELYDHKTAPDEITNLADDPAYRAAAKELSAILRAGPNAAKPE